MVGVVILQLLIYVGAAAVEGVGKIISAVVSKENEQNEQMVGCRSNEQGPLDELQTATAQSQQAIGRVLLGDQKDTVLSILSVPQNSPQPYY